MYTCGNLYASPFEGEGGSTCSKDLAQSCRVMY